MVSDNEVTRARLQALLPHMKDAWNVDHIELTDAAIVVHVREDHVLRFPAHLLAFPVEVKFLARNDSLEMAA